MRSTDLDRTVIGYCTPAPPLEHEQTLRRQSGEIRADAAPIFTSPEFGKQNLTVTIAPGFRGQPMTRADVERKFRSNVGKRWPTERTAAILQRLWALDRRDDVRGLLGGLSLQA
jgi:hypothetical protein